MSYLQRQLKYTLMLCQVFGILPVSGVSYDDPLKLKFSWCSWRISYTISLIVVTFFTVFMAFYNLCTSDFNLSNLSKYFLPMLLYYNF